MTAIEVVEIISGNIKASPVKNEISGDIYEFARPLNSTQEDVVISAVSLLNGQTQEGEFAINIWVPNTADNSTMPDITRLNILVAKLYPVLNERYGDGYNYTIEKDLGIFIEGNQSYNNLIIKFNTINF